MENLLNEVNLILFCVIAACLHCISLFFTETEDLQENDKEA